MSIHSAKDGLTTWLLGSAREIRTASRFLHEVCSLLNAHGFNLRRVNLLVRTRQPQLEMLVYIWRPINSSRVSVDTSKKVVGVRRDLYSGGEVETVLLAMGHTDEQTYRTSPFHACLEQNTLVRRQLIGADVDLDFPILHDLQALGVTDYFVLPIGLPFPYSGALSLATDAADGFSPDCLECIQALEPLLGLSLAPHVVQQATLSVLAAYIGIDPAHRVMSGAVTIGDAQTLDAVIGFTDLRGFTRLSHMASTEYLLHKLTTFFGAVHACVVERDGEILKFMGDGAMFVFPVKDGDVAMACRTALEAVRALQVVLSDAEALDDTIEDAGYYFATALHHGTVLYGNIGSAERLDFTVVGEAVNLTARLEPMAKRLGQDIVVSREFADACPGKFRLLGRVELAGVGDLVDVLSPVEPTPRGSKS